MRTFDVNEEIILRLTATEVNAVLSILDANGVHRVVRPIIDKIAMQLQQVPSAQSEAVPPRPNSRKSNAREQHESTAISPDA